MTPILRGSKYEKYGASHVMSTLPGTCILVSCLVNDEKIRTEFV
jgi:hypothetical protein